VTDGVREGRHRHEGRGLEPDHRSHERAHPELARQQMQRVVETLKDIAKVEFGPRQEGGRFTMTMVHI